MLRTDLIASGETGVPIFTSAIERAICSFTTALLAWRGLRSQRGGLQSCFSRLRRGPGERVGGGQSAAQIRGVVDRFVLRRVRVVGAGRQARDQRVGRR